MFALWHWLQFECKIKWVEKNRINLTDDFARNGWKYLYQMYGIRWKQNGFLHKTKWRVFFKPQIKISNIYNAAWEWWSVDWDDNAYILNQIHKFVVILRMVEVSWIDFRGQQCAIRTQQHNPYKFHFNFKSFKYWCLCKNCHFLIGFRLKTYKFLFLYKFSIRGVFGSSKLIPNWFVMCIL